MTVRVEAEFITAIWSALNKPPPTRAPRPRVVNWMLDIVERGWAGAVDIEDLPGELDNRIDLLHNIDRKKFAVAFDLPMPLVYRRPANSAEEVWGCRHLSAPNFAYMLIILERLGFRVDGTMLADLLRPALQAQSHVTGQEWDVLYYRKSRHKMEPLVLQNSAIGAWNGMKTEFLTTETGYRAELQSDDAGLPLWLTVTKPIRRRSKVAKSTLAASTAT